MVRIKDYVRATYQRWLENCQPVGEEPNLSESLNEIGRNPEQVSSKATSERVENALAAATDETLELGEFGSPTFVMDGIVFWATTFWSMRSPGPRGSEPPTNWCSPKDAFRRNCRCMSALLALVGRALAYRRCRTELKLAVKATSLGWRGIVRAVELPGPFLFMRPCQSGRRSSPWSTLPRSRARTSRHCRPVHRLLHRPAESSWIRILGPC